MKSYYNGAPTSGGDADVALGLVPGRTAVGKFGYNPDVDTAYEDLWDIGGDWPGAVTPETWNLRSASASDTSAGTGARTVTVEGLDDNYDVATETVTLNGTSNVATSNSYAIIYRMLVATAGSNLGAVGNIQATPITAGTARAQITAGFEQTLMAVYMVPDGHSLAIDRIYWGQDQPGGSIDITVKLRVKPFGGVFNTKRLIGGRSTGGSPTNLPTFGIVAPAKSLVVLSAVSSAANALVFGGFDGTLAQT